MGADATDRPFKFATRLDTTAGASREVSPTLLAALRSEGIVEHPLALTLARTLAFGGLAEGVGAAGTSTLAHTRERQRWHALGILTGVYINDTVFAGLATDSSHLRKATLTIIVTHQSPRCLITVESKLKLLILTSAIGHDIWRQLFFYTKALKSCVRRRARHLSRRASTELFGRL